MFNNNAKDLERQDTDKSSLYDHHYSENYHNSATPDYKGFSFGIHPNGKNKEELKKVAKGWEQHSGTVEDLAKFIKKGKAFMSGLLNETRHRANINVVSFQSVAVDIDSDMTLQEALEHPFTKKYCGLIYTSHSHQKGKTKPSGEKIEPCDRFRLVFPLPQPLEDMELWEYLWEYVNHQFRGFDGSCKDKSRLFFGNTEAEIVLCDTSKYLDESVLSDAKDRREIDKAKKVGKEIEKTVKKIPFDYNPEKTRELAEKALTHIPPREINSGNYHECLQILMALESEFGEDAIDMAENWSPSIPNSTWDIPYKIKSLKRSGVTVGTLFYIAQQYGFEMPTKKPTGKGVKSQNNLEQQEQWDSDKVQSELSAILSKSLEDSQIEVELGGLAKKSGWNYNSLKSSLEKLRLEQLYEGNREETKQTLEEILADRNADVDIFEVLPEGLARPVSKFSQMMGTKPIVMASALLCGVSGLNTPDTKLMLYEPTNFKVTPNLFGGMVGESSQKKSPVHGNMIEAGLKPIQKGLRKEYEQQLEDYKKAFAHWKNEGKKNGEVEPEKPNQKIVYFTNNTPEGIANQASKFPNQGLIYLLDELAGVMKSFNKYSNGVGDEQEILLSLYDGRGGVNLRADGIRADFSNTLLSLFGTIQPETLRDMMGSFDDSNGFWARIILVNQPLSPSFLSKGKGKFDLEPMIQSLYRKIYESQKDRLYRLSSEAEDVFIDYYNWCERLRTDKTRKPALRAMYGKSEGRAGKIALNLHKLFCAFTGKEDDGVISEEIMKIAIKLNLFYIKQILVIHNMLDDDDESQLTGLLSRIVEISENKGIGKPIKPREIRDGLTKRERKSSEEIKQAFYELEKLGYGKASKENRTVTFTLQTLSPDGDKSGANSAPATNLTTQGFQTTGDNWGQSGATSAPATIPTDKGIEEKWGQNNQYTPSPKYNNLCRTEEHKDYGEKGENTYTQPKSPHLSPEVQNPDSEGDIAGVSLSPVRPQLSPDESPEEQNPNSEGDVAGVKLTPTNPQLFSEDGKTLEEQAHLLTKDFLKERGLEGEQTLRDAIAFFNNPEIGFQAKKEEIRKMGLENEEIGKREREERKSLPRKVMFYDVVPFISDLNPLNPLTPIVLKEYFAMLPHRNDASARNSSLYPLIVTKRKQPDPVAQPQPEPKPVSKPEPQPEPQIRLRPYTPPQEKWAVDEETFKRFEKQHETDPLIDKDCVEKVRFAQDKEEDDPKIWWEILEIGKSNIQLKNRVTGETCRVLSYPCRFVPKDEIDLYKVGDGVALNEENPQYFEVVEVDSDANQLVLSSIKDGAIKRYPPSECLKVTWDTPS